MLDDTNSYCRVKKVTGKRHAGRIRGSFMIEIDEKNKNKYELRITSKNKNGLNNFETRTEAY